MKFLFFCLTFCLSYQLSLAASPTQNLEGLKHSLGFTPYYVQENPGRHLKVAILGKSFSGYEKEIGRSLPVATRYIPDSNISNSQTTASQGLFIAQVFTNMMTNTMQAPQWMPELSLYQVSSFAGFRSAIDDILNKKIDVVLYAEVWDHGSNFDGTGFLNSEVYRATRNGVIWVNAAGDVNLTTYNSDIKTLRDDWVQLPDANNALLVRCEENQVKCAVKITLTWNEFKNDSNVGTDKDLDLALTDDMLNILQTSTLKQTTDSEEARPGYTKYPREFIEAELPAGTYFLKVKNRSKNFNEKNRLRIVVNGNINMPSHSPGESILNPADNATVIVVGSSQSHSSSTSLTQDKPDLLVPTSDSAFASAIAAAGIGILKSQEPTLTRKDILAATTHNGADWSQRGLSLNQLAFEPTGPGCFIDVILSPTPNYLHEVLSRGGVFVQTTAAIRVMTPYDPIKLAPYLRRQQINDMIVAMPQGGYGIFPRYGIIPAGAVEIFQRPIEAGLCRPFPVGGKNFHL